MDDFSNYGKGLSSPVTKGDVIAPADVDLANIPRAIYVGGEGDVTGILEDDTAEITLYNVGAGSLLPFRFKRISASTTATLIVGVR